jgi:hypothetical protein
MNTLTISLPQVGPIAASRGARTYDPELDNITSVLVDICEALHEEGSVRFLVSGFGQERWPVDVYTDLPVAIEQVPAVLKAIRSGVSTTLEFYEQGVERILTIAPSGAAEVIVECLSGTSWQPQPREITMKRQDLLALLGAFLEEFVERARRRCPDLVDHPWFRAWIREGGLT